MNASRPVMISRMLAVAALVAVVALAVCAGCDDESKSVYKAANGLLWENPGTSKQYDYEAAIKYRNSLTLGGYKWRLPSISELRSLIRNCSATLSTSKKCLVKDDCLLSTEICNTELCWGCVENASPTGCYWDTNLSGHCSWYWSSSMVSDAPETAWFVVYDDGSIRWDTIMVASYIRCVSGGSAPTDGGVPVDSGTVSD